MFYEIYVIAFFGFFAICDGVYLCFCGVDEMSKYDWSNVPKEVNWIATDSDGWLSMHTQEPKFVEDIHWVDGSDDGYFSVRLSSPFKGDWKDSLEERPK